MPNNNSNDFDYSFWKRTRGSNPSVPEVYRDQHEREIKDLRHEISKAYAYKPLSCRDSDGNYRGSRGELLDPAALYHLGIEVPPPVKVEPGEPDWSLDVDPRRPLIGEVLHLSTPWMGKQPYLQLFKHTKAGPIPDGEPQSIRCGRLFDGSSIYACDHQPPPAWDRPCFYSPDAYAKDWQIRDQHCHPDQFAHLDPGLVAQELPHPFARFLPGAKPPYPWAGNP